MRDDFCAFILTHGRPDSVFTWSLLERSGYTGKRFLVVDTDDKTGPEYVERYGADSVLFFDKDAVEVDQFDQSKDRRTITWARNVCWRLAREVGCRYFMQLDDDYTALSYRRVGSWSPGAAPDYHQWKILDFDAVAEALVRFLETTPAKTIAMSQGGDHVGGKAGAVAVEGKHIKRKAMNSFVCDVERPITFQGRLNEDVNTYVLGNIRGDLFWTYMPLQLSQRGSQSTPGGITEVYLESGTYVKSFYTVMAAPSCVKVGAIGGTEKRLHHMIDWSRTAPKVLSERLRRE